MKAALCAGPGGPEVLRYAEIPLPGLDLGQLLVRVEAISIEGGDLVARRACRPGSSEVIGYAAAGEIVAVGADVRDFHPGQKVTTFGFAGSHAEFRAVPAATSWAVPGGLDLKTAAAIPCGAGTAASALRLGGVRAGQTVLILGATGGVGIAAVQLAKAMGARVLGAGRDPDLLEKLAAYGLDDAILVNGDATVAQQVRDLCGGAGADVLIDNVGGPVLKEGMAALADGATAVLVGVVGGPDEPLSSRKLLLRRQSVIGCLFGAVMHEPGNRALVEDLLGKAARGELAVPIDAGYALEDIAEAHRRAETPGRLGRVVVTPDRSNPG